MGKFKLLLLYFNQDFIKLNYFFEQPIPKKANGSPIKIYSILQGISIGAYFPSQSDCKAHRRLFSMGAYFWIGAYFPVNTV